MEKTPPPSSGSFWKRHQMKLVWIAPLLAFGLGMWARGDAGDPADSSTSTQAKTKPLFWTCSMHPEIQMPDNKKKCPKCQMDLIPVFSQSAMQKKTGLRQLTVSPEARELMRIQTTKVARQFVTAEIRMIGKVTYDETRLKHVTARVNGRLDRLFVDYTGVQVAEGDHMVSIYSEQLYTAQQELIEAIKAAKTPLPNNDLFDNGIDLVEASREKLRLLGLTAEQIDAIAKQSKPTDHVTFHSPISGIVIEKQKQEGDRVSVGERIYTVADLSHLWITLDAYESDLSWLRYGQEVEFTTQTYPGEVFTGRIAFIDWVLNPKTRTARVRVNVDNATGKLKPEMFVRAVVKSQIAAGGRVVDASLAGKWISPMHPEIIKDEPGICDVCGMPLVRAESLGYVPANPRMAGEPLVIPASAALITGTRAVVYVEDTKAKEPTFHGRQIVLGPRAGDYYIVESGLSEGEVVVTSGNFKIDSALQIQAQPSMMTPEGGGGGGGHHHGGSSSKNGKSAGKSAGEHDHAAHAGMSHSAGRMSNQLPVLFQDGVHAVFQAADQLKQALGTKQLTKIRDAFRQLGDRIQRVDASQLKEHPKLMWDELAMLLRNDAAEGVKLKEVGKAVTLWNNVEKSIAKLQQHLGIDRSHAMTGFDVAAEFQLQLRRIWDVYQRLSLALAKDDLPTALGTISDLDSAVKAIDMKLLTDADAHQAWMREQNNLTKIVGSLKSAKSLADLRTHFSSLSGEMFVVVRLFGIGPEARVYQHFCNMAFNNTGAAWLQSDSEVRNPYFGSKMFGCAERSELILGEPAPEERPNEDKAHEDTKDTK